MSDCTRGSGEHAPIDIDAAIDIIAREMTEVEPSPALRPRVLERIEAGRRRPGLALPRWAWAGVAAVVVLAVATGMWLSRPIPGSSGSEGNLAPRRGAAPGLSAAASPRPAQPVTTTAVPAGLPAPGTHVQLVRAARGAQPVAGAPAGAVAEDDALVHPLAEIEPLRFSNVEPAALHLPGVDVAPLDALPTIDIPSLNPGSTDAQSADPKKEK